MCNTRFRKHMHLHFGLISIGSACSISYSIFHVKKKMYEIFFRSHIISYTDVRFLYVFHFSYYFIHVFVFDSNWT